MPATKILWGQILLVCSITLLAVWGATQWTAWRLAFQAQLGPPWFEFAGWPLYPPPAFFWWWAVYDAYAPRIFVGVEAVAERSGWRIVAIYEDAGISGAKGRDKRPGFDRLLRDATRRQVDLIAAWSVDTLGRSLQDLVASLSELHALGIDLYLHQQAVDTTTPAGKALFPNDGGLRRVRA